MPSKTLKAQLGELIDSMLEEKLLNDHYYEIEMLRTTENPGFIVEILTMACNHSEEIMHQLNNSLNKNVLEYEEIDKIALKLHTSICSTGAERLVRVIHVLRQFCWANAKEGCLKAFAEVTREYQHLQSKLQMIIQLEKQIMMAEAQKGK